MKFSDIDLNEFAQLSATQSTVELGQKYHVHPRTIAHWRSRLRGTLDRDSPHARMACGHIGAAIAFPENAGEDFDQAFSLAADKTVIIGDAECPDHSIPTLELAIGVARKFGIKTLVINGDFIALDSFSAWAKTTVRKVFFRQELDAAVISLQVFLQTFDEIYWISGNHELRLPHMVDGEITVGEFLNQLTGVQFSEYAHLDLKSGDREILVCHQKNFSIVPLSVPSKLCIARHKNIWCAHNHRLAWGYDPSGQYWLVEGGHCRDEKKTHYKQLRVTTHPMWNPGVGMCIDGMPYLIDHNNASFWLSLQPPQIQTEMNKAHKKAEKHVRGKS